MKYMLDTNICIFAIKHKPPALIRNFLQHDPDDLCISAITYAELMHGVEKSQSTAQNRAAITLFLSAMAILSFDDWRGGRIWANPRRLGAQRHAHRPAGYADCRARTVAGLDPGDEQHPRVLPRGKSACGGLDKMKHLSESPDRRFLE